MTGNGMQPNVIQGSAKRYREGAAGTADHDPEKANKSQRKMHQAYGELRKTKEGKASIIFLLDDENPHVRCWAAAHSLEWEPVFAEKTLEDLKNSDGPCAFDAEMTLSEFRKGRLTFEY